MRFLESKGMRLFVRSDDLIIRSPYFFSLNVSDPGAVNEILVWCWGEHISPPLKLSSYCSEPDSTIQRYFPSSFLWEVGIIIILARFLANRDNSSITVRLLY